MGGSQQISQIIDARSDVDHLLYVTPNEITTDGHFMQAEDQLQSGLSQQPSYDNTSNDTDTICKLMMIQKMLAKARRF